MVAPKDIYFCHFYDSCGSPREQCEELSHKGFTHIREHIYHTKRYGEQTKVKLLCTNEWVYVDDVCPIKNHVSKGYHIRGVRQWSIGAGHNTSCPACLIKLAERKLKTDLLFQQKLIEYAKPDPKNEREDRLTMFAIFCKECYGMIFACLDDPVVIIDNGSTIKKYIKQGHKPDRVSKHNVQTNFRDCFRGCSQFKPGRKKCE